MKARTRRRTMLRRYVGVRDDMFNEPIDWAAHHRWHRKAIRNIKIRKRRTPRPMLHPALRIQRLPLMDPKAIAFRRAIQRTFAAHLVDIQIPPAMLAACARADS